MVLPARCFAAVTHGGKILADVLPEGCIADAKWVEIDEPSLIDNGFASKLSIEVLILGSVAQSATRG